MNLRERWAEAAAPEADEQAGFELLSRLETVAGPDNVSRLEPQRGDPYAELKTRVHGAVIDKLGFKLFGTASEADLHDLVRQAVEQELEEDGTPLTASECELLVSAIVDDIVGYGPLEPLLADDGVTEVMVNGWNQIYVERAGRLEATHASFLDDAHLLRIIDKIVSQVGRRIDEASPMVDARLPDGSRVNAIIPPLSLRGPALTIRKFSRNPFSAADLVGFGTLTRTSSDFLAACVRGQLNILISGGTGTGKTTLLNAISAFIPNEERIVTIEDAAELQLQQEHVVTLEARPPNIEGQGEVRIRELVRNALRMRPDRIVVGEVRSAETLDMLQAMNTGHEGSLTTVHANSPRDALSRIETLVLTAGVELPVRAIREQISSALDLIVHLSRLVDGSRRITHVTEVLRMESDVITLQDVFLSRPPGENEQRGTALLGPLEYTGLKPHFLDKLTANGVKLAPDFFREDAW
jgi:pilus assembly protein CpaF